MCPDNSPAKRNATKNDACSDNAVCVRHARLPSLTAVIAILCALVPVSCGLTGGQVRDVDTYLQTGSGERKWMPPFADGLHDPTVSATKFLQSPAEALLRLPPGMGGGNQTDWVTALEGGYINPRVSVYGRARNAGGASDVVMRKTGEMPMVLFPHDKHIIWLDCENCHNGIFKKKAGATPGLDMYSILEGRFCGKCHGAVAFPLTNCLRCHSVSRGAESVQHKNIDEWW